MAGDEGSPTDEHVATDVDVPWDGLLRRTGGDSDPADGRVGGTRRAGEPERREGELPPPPREANLPRPARRPVSSSSRVRLVAAAGLCALVAALALIALPAVRTDDHSSSPGRAPSGQGADPAAPERGIRGIRAKDPAPLRARRQRRARAMAGAKRKEGRASRRDGARARDGRVEPPPRAGPGALTALPPAPPAPEPSPPEEPASPPASRPRSEEGLVDGSRSSTEFGL